MSKHPKPTAMEERGGSQDDRMFSPSTARNKGPILEVLRPFLTKGARIFEIASGTGEHGVHMVGSVPGIVWQPSDQAAEALKSIAAWQNQSNLTGLLPPLQVDASAHDWPDPDFCPVDVVVCINMFHISPWSAGVGVIRGAGRALRPGGHLCIYGPFSENGIHNATSNETFDAQLRATDPQWGIRDIEDLTAEAKLNGLTVDRIVEMPANNKTLIYRRIV